MSSIIEANSFVGPWEERRNFSWATIDQVNLNSYLTFSTKNNCTNFEPGPIEPDDDIYILPEIKNYPLKSATSNTSSSKSSTSDKDNETITTRSKSTKTKKKILNTKSTQLSSSSSKSNTPTQLRNKKTGSNSSSSNISKLDQVNQRIEAQLNQLKSGQKYYYNNIDDKNNNIREKSDLKQKNIHDVQNLSNLNQFEAEFSEKNISNYNPSTLYRLKKLQDTELLSKRKIVTNLIATLDTNTDSNKVFANNPSDNIKKCNCCDKLGEGGGRPSSHFLKNNNNTSKSNSSSNCSCSENEFDTSDVSFGEVNKTSPTILQRVKSVTIVRNKNIEFIQAVHPKNKLKEIKTQQPILRVHKYNNNNASQINALKQYSSGSIGLNKKIIRSGINQNQNTENNLIVKNNKIEQGLDTTATEFDNSFSSARSRINQSPSSLNKIYGGRNRANNATFYGSSINHIRNPATSLQSKYPETLCLSGKSFLTGDVANLSFSSNKNAPKVMSKRITSAESEKRDLQFKFNQLTKIGV